MIHGCYVSDRLEILVAWGFQENLKIFAQHLSNTAMMNDGKRAIENITSQGYQFTRMSYGNFIINALKGNDVVIGDSSFFVENKGLPELVLTFKEA